MHKQLFGNDIYKNIYYNNNMNPTELTIPEHKDTIVIKIGTSSLMTSDQQLDICFLGRLVSEVNRLKKVGYRVVITTSGAVGFGCQAMKLKTRPTEFNELAALSGIGQSKIMVK
jgi:glutamate 5-kinase